ncbi:hypothetical protein F2P81_013325 [Scophthalmus maximus]|uniref:Uncharacterized protein n=1 Tax=Scophthalmus maximus TaxID=52904 RepID=A0A6A4SQD9_SCOMX|nr:hypothetical protein F2P81_013325 [Scophthalmus maximus]
MCLRLRNEPGTLNMTSVLSSCRHVDTDRTYSFSLIGNQKESEENRRALLSVRADTCLVVLRLVEGVRWGGGRLVLLVDGLVRVSGPGY